MGVNFLAEKHTGMKVSSSGLLGRIADGCKIRPDQRYMLGEMYKHLQEMAERFYSGDMKAVDEFLQLYCLDEKRPGSTEELYYLQDKRSYVGNDMLFWANGGGYTTDISKAEVFTKERAVSQHKSRETDIPWPKGYIDSKTRPAVDMQYVRIDEALKGTGIKLVKPEPPRKAILNCHGCGRFLSEFDAYNGCPKCGADNSH